MNCKKILVSSCLCGKKCRYNGSCVNNSYIENLTKEEIIEACPELLGGLSIPREPCEIVGGNAEDVWNNKARILSKTGNDYTEQYKLGSNKVLEIIRQNKIKKAILKQNSPSCGYGKIYDGKFSGNKIEGNGILAELLKKNGITIISVE